MHIETEREPKQQSAKALLALRDLVLTGEIEPGERLSEVALAQRLNVSRTPLRSAMQRLEQEGLVTLIPSGGYAVRSFSKQEVRDAIELRGVLEGTAARMAAERGVSAAQIMALDEVVHQLDHVTQATTLDIDFARYELLNGQFHRLLWKLCESELLSREIERMASLPFASPNAFVNTQADAPAFHRTLIVAQAQHKSIVVAIKLREGARAESVAREHARLARQHLDFVLEEQPDLRRKVLALALMSG